MVVRHLAVSLFISGTDRPHKLTSHRSAMSKHLNMKPKEYVIIGVVLLVIGYAGSISLKGDPLVLAFDTAAVMGWVSLIGGIMQLYWARKAK